MQDSPSDGQLDLFDQDHLEDRESMAAAAPEPLRKLARRIPKRLFLGTSSWSFPGWSGLVYSRRYPQPILAREGLRAYARHPLLSAVGVDRSYYAPLSQEELEAYAAQVPDRFRFVVKAAETCVAAFVRETASAPPAANPLFLDPVYAAEELVAPMMAGLKEKAAVLLFQFPPQAPQPGRDFRLRLESFLTRLPAGPLYAVELRNRSLLTQDHFRMLEAAAALHCFNIHPGSFPLDRQLELAGGQDSPLLVRWMLHPGLEYEEARKRYAPFDRLVDPQPATRERIVARCRETLRSGQPAFVIVNNKAEGSAPLSVGALAEKLAE